MTSPFLIPAIASITSTTGRILDNGNLLLFDNGNGRPVAEGGTYSRALELSLDWETMTAKKVWEYKHSVTALDGTQTYKYLDAVGTAHRLDNGNTLVLFGADVDTVTLTQRNPRMLGLVEADSNSEAGAVAVLDFQMTGGTPVYRAVPLKTLFGEVSGTAQKQLVHRRPVVKGNSKMKNRFSHELCLR